MENIEVLEGQVTMFDILEQSNKLRVLSLFSGIGAFEKALRNINLDFELVNYCEIDKFASKSYSLIHGVSEKLNLWDVTKIDPKNLKNFDLLTHGSPCQSFSAAGKQEGGDKGSGTTSSLMWETVQIIKSKKPKYVIWENVKNVLSKRHIHNFQRYIDELGGVGYSNYYKVLNSCDYGIPQNRERIFVISILGESNFEFPKIIKLEKTIKDILEEDVDEKFYMNKPFELLDKNTNKSVCRQIAKLDIKGNDIIRRVYDVNYCSPTLSTCGGGHREAKILEIKPGAIRGRYFDGVVKQRLELRKDNISNCLTTVQTDSIIQEKSEYSVRVRKLTPKEYWRLQGFDDEDFYKCKDNGISNSQLYKQAGNSITVNVLENIFKNLFC